MMAAGASEFGAAVFYQLILDIKSRPAFLAFGYHGNYPLFMACDYIYLQIIVWVAPFGIPGGLSATVSLHRKVKTASCPFPLRLKIYNEIYLTVRPGQCLCLQIIRFFSLNTLRNNFNSKTQK
jgi:hypothetical protein